MLIQWKLWIWGCLQLWHNQFLWWWIIPHTCSNVTQCPNPKQTSTGCCKEITLKAPNTSIFHPDYSSFFGVWRQDGQSTHVGKRPVYRKGDNPNLFLASSEVKCQWSEKVMQAYAPQERHYPLPWIMWGGPYYKPGTSMGNIKMGYDVHCPNDTTVERFHFCLQRF